LVHEDKEITAIMPIKIDFFKSILQSK